LGGTVKNILILGAGNPFACDDGFGCHVVSKLLEMDLPENVECWDCGYSASEFVHVIDGKDKMIFIDAFRSSTHEIGDVLRMTPEEIELSVDGIADVPKIHLIEVLDEIALSGKCPETILVGVVPKEINKTTEEMTPEIACKVPEVMDLILEEIKKAS
jgi:hydrogenase maturation protease